MPAAKLTPKLRDELCDLLRKGHYVKSACAFVGLGERTFRDWQERGNAARVFVDQGKRVPAAEKPYFDFIEAVDMARDYGEAWLVERCLEAAQNPRDHGRWQAYMTILERSRPSRWARKPRDQQEAATPLASRIELQRLSPEQREQLKSLLRAMVPSGD